MTVQELFKAAQELPFADQIHLASQIMQSISKQTQTTDSEAVLAPAQDDPLVGLFSGSPNLSSCSPVFARYSIVH